MFLLAIIENQADNTYNSNYMYKDWFNFLFSELKIWMEENFTSLKELFDETSR